MNLMMLITFVRSFRGGGLNDGSKPEIGAAPVYVCPACGSEEVVDNGHFDHAQRGRLLMCQECFEVGSAFEFIEISLFGA